MAANNPETVTPLGKAMFVINEGAKEAGEEPSEYAKKVLAEVFGVMGERLGEMMDKHGDPVEALAFIMLEDIRRGDESHGPN